MLTWDNDGERYYETGVDQGVLYPYNASAKAYVNGVAWNGLTNVAEAPEGAEETALYADNIKYLSLRSAENFNYTINCYTYPDEFIGCDGGAEPVTGVKMTQQARKRFGFAYRTLIGNDEDGDEHGYKYHLVYNSTASPSSGDNNTVNDTPAAKEFAFECSTTPVEVPTGYKKTSHIVIDSTKVDSEKLTAFLNKLYGGTTNYVPLVVQPDDWTTGYANYYTKDGQDYTALSSATDFVSGSFYMAAGAYLPMPAEVITTFS